MKASAKMMGLSPRRFLILNLLFALVLATSAWGASEPDSLVNELSKSSGGKVHVGYHSVTGKVRFLRAEPGAAIPQPFALPRDAAPDLAAKSFLTKYGSLFGITDPSKELTVKRERKADRGRSFVRFQQVYKGVPVIGGELIVQMDSSNNIISAQAKILPDIGIDTSPVISSVIAQERALEVVLKHYRKKYDVDRSSLQVKTPDLWIYNPVLLEGNDNLTHLVWRMEVSPTRTLPIRELVLVDAHHGDVVLHFNQIDAALSRKIYDHNNTEGKPLPGDPSDLKRSEGDGSSGITDVDYAYDYAGDTYNFYWDYHGRDSLDNLGMVLISTTRFCPGFPYPCPFANAFWEGTQMVYGDGFASADDVVAHEMTHGVTEHESNLIYLNQSGAINESFSDIWGEFVDLTNGKGNDDPSVKWLMGEDLPPEIGAIRDMGNPPAFGDPDSIGSSNHYCGPSDNGGVHINSGIVNKTAYLMTDGGTFNGITVTAVGITKVAKIFYEAQTNLLISSSDFTGLYDALNQACANLIGTDSITDADCQEVDKALKATKMDKKPASCTGLIDPGFERGPFYGWGEFSSGFYYIVTNNPSMAYSGDWFAWLGGYDYAEDYIYQEIEVPSNATQAYLQFWYNITTDETTTTAYDKMFVQLYREGDDGYLYLVKTFVTLSNAKKTTGWVQSPKYSLSYYKGKKLYLIFYVLNDWSSPTNFLVDGVSLMPVFGYPPVVTSLKINGTALSTSKALVKLNNAAKNSPTHYMASEDPNFAGAIWQTYSTAPAFTLSTGSGIKTVYFKIKNGFEESTPAVSDTILALAPSVTSLKINYGATSTTNPVVKLNNTAANSPTHYMASEDPAFTGASWQTYSTAPAFTLSGGPGTKTVYFKVKNGFEQSTRVQDDISLNQ